MLAVVTPVLAVALAVVDEAVVGAIIGAIVVDWVAEAVVGWGVLEEIKTFGSMVV